MPGTSRSGGRNRRSRAEHQLAGTYRRDRHGPKTAPAEPDPPQGRPACPCELPGVARLEWDRMVKRLEDAKTIATVDDAALYQYCCLFAETEGLVIEKRENAALVAKLITIVERLEEILAADRGDDEPLDIKLDVDTTIAQIVQLKKLDAKYSTQLRQGHMAIRQYLVEFGMTPAARTRVKVTTPASATPRPTDLFAEFDEPAAIPH